MRKEIVLKWGNTKLWQQGCVLCVNRFGWLAIKASLDDFCVVCLTEWMFRFFVAPNVNNSMADAGMLAAVCLCACSREKIWSVCVCVGLSVEDYQTFWQGTEFPPFIFRKFCWICILFFFPTSPSFHIHYWILICTLTPGSCPLQFSVACDLFFFQL